MGIVLNEPRLVRAWLSGVEHLKLHGGTYRNIVLEIERPQELSAADLAVLGAVNPALRAHSALSIETVAGTIFPQGQYLRHGPDAFAERFLKIMKRAKKRNTWGTYAMRLLERSGRQAGSKFNPLAQVVAKLKRASTEGHPYQSVYELSPHVAEDLDETPYEIACELPTFDAALDGAKVGNMPCLSHLTFKMVSRTHVELTAIYRSHYYASRALGNLVGLSHLLSYVAKQSGLQVGRLTCISTHAVLDADALGKAGQGQALLARLTTD